MSSESTTGIMSMSMGSSSTMSMGSSSAMSMGSSSTMASVSSSIMSMGSSSAMSMSMGSSTTTSMSMPTSTSSSMTMSMSTATSSASAVTTTSSGMSGMSGMSSSSTSSTMDMDMSMNYYLTSKWENYPVLFSKLKANTRGKLFGIFLLLIVAAFVYKATGFALWYLELKWSKVSGDNSSDLSEEEKLLKEKRGRSFVGEIFLPSGYDFVKDAVRAVLVFWSTLLAYMLMLAAMSFVLTYIFGIVLGLALFEVFFNRIKIVILRERRLRTISECKTSNVGVCTCGDHNFSRLSTDVDTIDDKKPQQPTSCCGGKGAAALTEEEAEHNVQVVNQITNNNPAQMNEELEPSSRFM